MNGYGKLSAFATAALVGLTGEIAAAGETQPLLSVAAAPGPTAHAAGYDGVVEAVRQTVVSAQVPGAVVAVHAKIGERVKAGQVLLRLDARAAEQQAGAAAAQVLAARAAQDVAIREFERQKLLFDKNYISQAALERAEAQYKSAQAQATAQLASAGAARTESGFYVIKAPYDGVVSDVAVVLGDMAMPGKSLLTLYDPGALRVTAAVPQSAAYTYSPQAVQSEQRAAPQAELPGIAVERIRPSKWQVLPTVDPATHTVEVRLDLPPGTAAAPGMFARAWLSGASDAQRITVPVAAVVRRAELTGVYVIGIDGKPLLRQVRLGPTSGDQVEVLSGVGAGERVALDPQAAARVR